MIQVTPLKYFRRKGSPAYGSQTYYTHGKDFCIEHDDDGWSVRRTYTTVVLTESEALSVIEGARFKRRKDAVAALEQLLASEKLG